MMKRIAKPEKETPRSSFKPQQQSRFAPRPFPAHQPEHGESSAECREPLFSYNLLDIPTYPRESVQPKLRLGPVGDRYEQEADRVAQQVVSTISSPEQDSVQRQEDEDEDELDLEELEEEDVVAAQRQTVCAISSPDPDSIQRQDDEDELDLEEPLEEDEELQRKVAGFAPAGGADVEPGLESAILGARGQGQPLSDGVRQPMERAFGADFGRVRVHNDAQADSLNRSIQARAFTTGQDVFFRQGEFRPGSSEGKRLLAHELTHVVQQGEGRGQAATEVVGLPVDDSSAFEIDVDMKEVTAQKNHSEVYAQSEFMDHRVIKHKKNDSVLKQSDNIIQMKRPSEGVWDPDTEKIYVARSGKTDIYKGGRPCHFSTTVKEKLLTYWSAPRFNWVKRINDRWIVETPRTHYFLPPDAIQIDHLTPWATYEDDLTKDVDTNRTDIPKDAKTNGKFSVWGARMYYHDAENLVPEVPSLNAGKGAQLTEGVTYSGSVSEKSNKLLGNISQVAFSLSEWQNIWTRLDQEGKMDKTAISEIDIKLQTIFDSILDLKNFTEELNI